MAYTLSVVRAGSLVLGADGVQAAQALSAWTRTRSWPQWGWRRNKLKGEGNMGLVCGLTAPSGMDGRVDGWTDGRFALVDCARGGLETSCNVIVS